MSCVTLYFSARWSSQRLESMRRPSTSSCMSPTMGGVQTMPCWRPQGARQDDLIIWMRMRSETELSEFVGFISNDLMTALTTTSDLSSSTRQPVSLTLDSLCTTLVPYITQQLYFNYFTSFFSRRLLWDEICTIQQCVVVMWFYVVFVCPLAVFFVLSDGLHSFVVLLCFQSW